MTWLTPTVRIASVVITITGIVAVCAGCVRGMFLLLKNGVHTHWAHILHAMSGFFLIGIVAIIVKTALQFVLHETWENVGLLASSVMLFALFSFCHHQLGRIET